MYYMESMDIFFYIMNRRMSVRMKKNLSVLMGSFFIVIFLFMLVEYREEKVLFLRGN